MIRYGFNIRTRTGQRVDNISIMAGSLADAERRLRQMYLQCEIVDCREQAVPRRLALDVAKAVDDADRIPDELASYDARTPAARRQRAEQRGEQRGETIH